MNPKKKITLPDYKRLPDEELAYRFAHRQEATALYHIYDRYAHLVYGVALHQTDSVSRAKEVTHHLFLSLIDALPHAQIISFKSWLLDYTIAFIEGKTATLSVDELAGNMLYDNHTKRNSFEDARNTSACITRKQLGSFLAGTLLAEEQAALQMHIASCPICSQVAKGAGKHSAASGMALQELSSVYLKDHYNLLHPTIHLNALAVSAPAQAVKRRKLRGLQQPATLHPSVIVATIMLGFAALWYMQFGKKATAVEGGIPQEQTISNSSDATTAAITSTDSANTPVENPVPVKSPVSEPTPVQPVQGSAASAAALVSAPAEPVVETSNPVSATEQPAPTKKEEAVSAPAPVQTEEKGEEILPQDGQGLYEQGKYGAALSFFKKAMQQATGKNHDAAALMAAKCYIGMGQSKDAEKLLMALASDGSGAERRKAKRLLKDMGTDISAE